MWQFKFLTGCLSKKEHFLTLEGLSKGQGHTMISDVVVLSEHSIEATFTAHF